MMYKILVVEDEVIIGLDIAQKLKSLGYEVTASVCTPEEALSSIKECVPDMALMDINLKADIDGIELAAQFKKIADIPVIYLTSYSDVSTIERAVSTEPYGYIIKPNTMGVLDSTLKTAFKRLSIERESEENKKMLSTLFDSISNAVAIINDECKIDKANKFFFTIFNIEGENVETLQSVFESIFDKHILLNLCENSSQDIIHVDIDGCVKQLLVNITPFIWENRNRHLLNVTDLTEMYKMKSALRVAENRFSKIFRKKMVPAVLVNKDDLEIYELNEAFINVYQVSESECAENSISRCIGKETADEIDKRIKSGNHTFKLDKVKQKSGNGDIFYADFRGKRVNFDDGEYILIDIYDVTDQVQMEENEKSMQQKLIHTNKMTSLGTLVSGVAHEINNPNNFIMFNSSLLLDFWESTYQELKKHDVKDVDGIEIEEFKDDMEKLLHGLTRGSERIKGIVHDLKGFAKTEDSDSFEQLQLSTIIETAIRILEHQINKITDNFVINIQEDMPLISGNKQKIEQVIINIIMNALEAVSSREQRIEVRCFKADNYCILEVADEGVGIAPEHLDRITDPFFTTRQSDGGTGLGLSIAYSILQEHKGILEVSSEQGKGTTVKIAIPEVNDEQK